MARRFLALVAVGALALAACTGDDDGASVGDNDVVVELGDTTIRLVASLQTLGDCEAVLDHLRREGSSRVGPWGFQEGGWYGGRFLADVAEEAADDSATAADGEGGLVEGVDFSGTNVQELGVDEPDIVKTDGRYLYVVSGGELVVVDASTVEVVGRTTVAGGWSPQLFLHGDEVTLITQGADEGPVIVDDGDARSDDPVEEGLFAQEWEQVVVQRIVVDDGRPDVVETLRVQGVFLSARSVDGVMRVVVRSDPQWRMPFVYPQSSSGEDRAEAANREVVEQSDIDDWLPHFQLEQDGGVVTNGLLPSCDAVHAPTEFSGFGVVSVMSLPAGRSLDPSATTAVLAPGDIVYASPASLYVATQTWFPIALAEDDSDWERLWDARRVNLHRFDITGPGASYMSSGSVPGEIRNQFSLSEHDGHLRVVTTTGDPWGETSRSQVRVLQERDDTLEEVGSVDDIGNGEAVQAVRFAGNVGYVVTFRRIDPFYTVDLSDPTAPAVLGELKIPGFSSYLHPIGDGLVLGVGSDATDEGAVTGAKVSLFDVTDLLEPEEIAVWSVPDGWNDIGWEHRSFLWWEPQRLAVIPVQVWSDNWAGAVVLRVDDNGISEVGRIDHRDDDAAEPGTTDCRTLGVDDFADLGDAPESELTYILREEGALLLACGSDQRAEAAGYDCFEEPWLAEEGGKYGLELGDGDRLVMCWPGQALDTIVRSVVIADDLWTLSYRWGDTSQPGRLQVNDLITLEREHTLPM